MAKTLFDHINAIYLEQKKNYFSTLDDGEKRTYSNYMVNRFLSMNIHQLPLVNEIQKYNLPSDVHYLFLATTIPRGKQYNKYVKAAKETKYEDWLVDLVLRRLPMWEIIFVFSKQCMEQLLILQEKILPIPLHYY